MIYFFLSYLTPFISFSCLNALGKIPSAILNSSGENRCPCLVLDIKGSFISLIVLAEVFSNMAFIMLRYVFSLPIFWVVIVKRCWILSKKFFFCIWCKKCDHVVFVFPFVNGSYKHRCQSSQIMLDTCILEELKC